MSTIFQIPLNSETLSLDEVHEITGCARKSEQINWLMNNGWEFHTNRAGEPIVGRLFARLRLAGITPNTMSVRGWVPDFSGIQ